MIVGGTELVGKLVGEEIDVRDRLYRSYLFGVLLVHWDNLKELLHISR